MYKAEKIAKVLQHYMEALPLQTGAPAVYWEYITGCIYVVEAKILTPRVKHIDFPICFLLEKIDNGIFVPKYEKYSIDMCNKLCSGLIISWINKWMTGFILYPTRDTEHYQLMRLYDFVVI